VKQAREDIVVTELVDWSIVSGLVLGFGGLKGAAVKRDHKLVAGQT
jgi:hypothetical protein